MIKRIFMENYTAFQNKVELNFEADKHTKKFSTNISQEEILKTSVIFGPNNTGKTKIIEVVETIKDILTNVKNIILPNIFSKKDICKLGIEFIENNEDYQYEFWVNIDNEFIYEKFSKITNNKEETLLLKNTINNEYICKQDKSLEEAIKNTSNNNIIIYTLNTDYFDTLQNMKNILTSLANKIEVVDMNYIKDNKTIDFLKNQNKLNDKIVKFIKNADLYLDNYYYDNNLSFLKNSNIKEESIVIKNNHQLDQFKMTSVYNGIKVPSIMFDSLGTKKIAALASYVIESLEEGKYLFIDELDSSLHFKLTRAIVSMFNSDLNKKAQLVCTIHDISLLDIKSLFRKDQIWFTDKNEEEITIYPLKSFSYDDSGIRDTSDLQEKYKKGILGAIPEPNLIVSLLEDEDE